MDGDLSLNDIPIIEGTDSFKSDVLIGVSTLRMTTTGEETGRFGLRGMTAGDLGMVCKFSMSGDK